SSLGLYFTGVEAEQLRQIYRHFRARHYCYCSFENRFAKSGGLAAVTVNILPYTQALGLYQSVQLFTPYYPHLMDADRLQKTGHEWLVPFADSLIQTELYQFIPPNQASAQNGMKEYYIKADGYFNAQNAIGDPYLYYPGQPVENQKALVENSLFFCQAVPYALQALGLEEGSVLHLQEWQTALLALTGKQAMLSGIVKSCLSMITLHNPYDAFLSCAALQKVVPREKADHVSRFLYSGATAYQIGLSLIDAPITTVSDTFAQEFTQDALQTVHFTPHLQSYFLKNGVRGVNNGPFISFSNQFPKKENHTLHELREIKLKNRHQLLQILDAYQPTERFGELSWRRGPLADLPDDVPILVMSGRLDLMQKGFDVLLSALEKFSQDEIKAVLTPMPVRAADLDYFYQVACKCRGNLTVFPMRMKEGYAELQAGSTFGLMPSIYEPFGAAIEYMANGTVTIARATGGLIDQIEANVSGLLYREPVDAASPEGIKAFMSTPIAALRKQNAWFNAMADSLADCLIQASALYRNQPDRYYAMVQQGFLQASRFSWSKTAESYASLVRQVAPFSSDFHSEKGVQ
ncbi:MAG TPA: glycogen/starch synthase, partial [bacterium]|nr:glycogen/starch synthase [bacterium]